VSLLLCNNTSIFLSNRKIFFNSFSLFISNTCIIFKIFSCFSSNSSICVSRPSCFSEIFFCLLYIYQLIIAPIIAPPIIPKYILEILDISLPTQSDSVRHHNIRNISCNILHEVCLLFFNYSMRNNIFFSSYNANRILNLYH
jgi:hypothetical protein